MKQSICAAVLAFVLASCNYNNEGEGATKAIVELLKKLVRLT